MRSGARAAEWTELTNSTLSQHALPLEGRCAPGGRGGRRARSPDHDGPDGWRQVAARGQRRVGKTTLLRAFARSDRGGFEALEGHRGPDEQRSDLPRLLDAEGRPRVEHGDSCCTMALTLAVLFQRDKPRAARCVACCARDGRAQRARLSNRDSRCRSHRVRRSQQGRDAEETFELAAAPRATLYMIEVSGRCAARGGTCAG